jgi:hypothetical protein
MKTTDGCFVSAPPQFLNAFAGFFAESMQLFVE